MAPKKSAPTPPTTPKKAAAPKKRSPVAKKRPARQRIAATPAVSANPHQAYSPRPGDEVSFTNDQGQVFEATITEVYRDGGSTVVNLRTTEPVQIPVAIGVPHDPAGKRRYSWRVS